MCNNLGAVVDALHELAQDLCVSCYVLTALVYGLFVYDIYIYRERDIYIYIYIYICIYIERER